MKAIALPGLVFLLTGCMMGAGVPELRVRAAFDLDCPKEDLKLTKLADNDGLTGTNHGMTYGIRGCGKRATYVNQRGAWIQNSEVGNGKAKPPRD